MDSDSNFGMDRCRSHRCCREENRNRVTESSGDSGEPSALSESSLSLDDVMEQPKPDKKSRKRNTAKPGSLVDRKVKLNDAYLDTKTNMLEIIQESLALKLEINSVKEQFLSLLSSAHVQGSSSGATKSRMRATMDGVPTQPTTTSHARQKVRALYEVKRARMSAKKAGGCVTGSPVSASGARVRRHGNARRNHDGDKENRGLLGGVGCSPFRSVDSQPYAPTTRSTGKCICTPRTRLRRLLAPIRDDNNTHFCAVCQRKGGKDGTSGGDYVRIREPKLRRSPRGDPGEYVWLRGPRYRRAQQLEDTSTWCGSDDDHKNDVPEKSAELSTCEYSSCNSPSRIFKSPVMFAKSGDITDLYTARSLRDVSQIKPASNVSLREQVSSASLSAGCQGQQLHSTFNYPLHSTLNCPLDATFDDLADELKGDGNMDAVKSDGSSDDSGKSKDDTMVEKSPLVDCVTPPKTSPETKPPPPSQFTAQLCKEHGVHPTFGEDKCIFSADDSSCTLLDESSDADSPQEARLGGEPVSDCDSSYLSECVDEGVHFAASAKDLQPTYDARNGIMKLLRRQTGQGALDAEAASALRPPVGMSASDLLEVSRKHLSLEATRASMPDLSTLSGMDLSPSDDDLDLTVRADPVGKDWEDPTDGDIRTHMGEEESGSSLESTMLQGGGQGQQQRPNSLATSATDESPESVGLLAPVNSPNITDSGGSSSKPTTDNYDYVEIPPRPSSALPPRHPDRGSRKRPAPMTPAQLARANQEKAIAMGRVARKHTLIKSSDSISSHSLNTVLQKSPSKSPNAKHFVISERGGQRRTVVQHRAVGRNLQRDRKRALAKKIKQFNQNFHKVDEGQNILTLGHF